MSKIKILLCFLLITVVVFAQRGGGSRSSSSRSGSSYRRRYRRGKNEHNYINFWGWLTGNETFFNYTALEEDEKEMQEENGSFGETLLGAFMPLIVLGGCLFGSCLCCRLCCNGTEDGAEEAKTKETINKIFSQFQGEAEANMCTLDEQQMVELKDWFMSQKWLMQIRTYAQTFNDKVEITLKDISSRSRYSYNISFSAMDSIGGSECKGILAHQGDHLSIIFQKVYNDKNKSGQTNGFENLIYRGVQQGNEFNGNWYYHGHEYSKTLAGDWRMYPKFES